MREEHRHIHERIDGLEEGIERLGNAQQENTNLLKQHVAQEDEDRRDLLKKQDKILTTTFMGIGAWALSMVVFLLVKTGGMP
jgi:Fe2+ transport system protein B